MTWFLSALIVWFVLNMIISVLCITYKGNDGALVRFVRVFVFLIEGALLFSAVVLLRGLP